MVPGRCCANTIDGLHLGCERMRWSRRVADRESVVECGCSGMCDQRPQSAVECRWPTRSLLAAQMGGRVTGLSQMFAASGNAVHGHPWIHRARAPGNPPQMPLAEDQNMI